MSVESQELEIIYENGPSLESVVDNDGHFQSIMQNIMVSLPFALFSVFDYTEYIYWSNTATLRFVMKC